MEQQLGTALFERVGPKLKLTDAGKSYAEEITQILSDLETDSIDVVRGSKAQSLLRIAVQDSLASTWLAARLPRFVQNHPNEALFQIEPVKESKGEAENPADVSILRGRGGPGARPIPIP